MSIERWYSGPVSRVVPRGGWYDEDVQSLQAGMPVLVLVTVPSTYTPGDVLEIAHGLGRVPRGMTIVNQVLGGSPSAGCSWWREGADAAWTERVAAVRFSAADAALALAFF